MNVELRTPHEVARELKELAEQVIAHSFTARDSLVDKDAFDASFAYFSARCTPAAIKSICQKVLSMDEVSILALEGIPVQFVNVLPVGKFFVNPATFKKPEGVFKAVEDFHAMLPNGPRFCENWEERTHIVKYSDGMFSVRVLSRDHSTHQLIAVTETSTSSNVIDKKLTFLDDRARYLACHIFDNSAITVAKSDEDPIGVLKRTAQRVADEIKNHRLMSGDPYWHTGSAGYYWETVENSLRDALKGIT